MTRILIAASILAATLFLPGCVVLTGQRITLHRDVTNDRLHVLIHYDGIHDSDPNAGRTNTEKSLQLFAGGGEIMLFDWWGHMSHANLERGSKDAHPDIRAFVAKLRMSARTSILGRYRDPKGRLGVAQEIVFEDATGLLEAANKALDAQILSDDKSGGLHRSWPRMRARAEKGGQWLAFDGEAIVVDLPMDLMEWGHVQSTFLHDVAIDDNVFSESSKTTVDRHGAIQFLSSAPISIDQSAAGVRFRIGHRDRPTTFRVRMRTSHEPNLDAEIEALVPTDFEARVAAALLGGEVSPRMQRYLGMAPPEQNVAAVLKAARGDDAALKRQAHLWLAGFAKDFVESYGPDAAPEHTGDDATWRDQWDSWYETMIASPR